jgi:hypothetical protein
MEQAADILSLNLTGAWTIHIVLIIGLKILYDTFPGVSQETSWTLTNISYMLGSYIMFHYVRGVPFEFNGGAYDNLNMWEQIDDGAQYTPAKKFLLSVPIVLFLLSTHYTHYDLAYFTINFLAVLAVIVPKLPFVSLRSCPPLFMTIRRCLVVRRECIPLHTWRGIKLTDFLLAEPSNEGGAILWRPGRLTKAHEMPCKGLYYCTWRFC